jgi:redox-sensitive bicupin YhaK (pirin superfamily)
MPWVPIEGGRIKALAGEWAGARGPVQTPARIAYAHLELSPGATFSHPLPEGWSAAVVVLHGAVSVSGREVLGGQVGRLTLEGEGLDLASAPGASFLLLAGLPLGEPIAHHGPFVMSSREELEEAFAEYQSGRMGRLD